MPQRGTPRSSTRQWNPPAPSPARPKASIALSVTRCWSSRRRFRQRDTVGMAARSRPLRPVKMPVSRPTPARSATQPGPKRLMLPGILPLILLNSLQPALSPDTKSVPSARSVTQFSPAWRRFPRRGTPRSSTRQSPPPAQNPVRPRASTARSAMRFSWHRQRFPRRDTPRRSAMPSPPPTPRTAIPAIPIAQFATRC